MSAFPRRRASHAGLSISEVLVIMLIVGTLAAIVLPVYLGDARAAKDAAAEADATDLGERLRSLVEEGGSVREVTSDDDSYLFDGEVVLERSTGVEIVTYKAGSAQEWCIELRHPDGSTAGEPGFSFRTDDVTAQRASCA